MSKKISLQKIIEATLTEKGVALDESIIRSLRRDFERLIKKMGGDKAQIKSKNGKIEFDESEVPFIKVIMRQLYDKKGLVAKFTNEHTDISSSDIHKLIQSIIDEEDKNGATEDELVNLACFLDNIFFCAPLYSIENCHLAIDTLVLNLQDLTSTQQAVYLSKVEHTVKKEVKLRIAESAINALEICESIELSKQLYEYDIGIQGYCEFDSKIRLEYVQRDKNTLAKIQEDDDLRYYIEKKIGKKAEEIFNYATLSCEI